MFMPLHQHNYASSLSHNHAYYHLSFLLTLIDVASLAVLSLCAALWIPSPFFLLYLYQP